MKRLNDLTRKEFSQLYPILLEAHHSDWGMIYQNERSLIRDCIGEHPIARINHIGSTSVPGLIAKPTIDILLEIMGESQPEDWLAALEAAGYSVLVEPENPPPHLLLLKGYGATGFSGQAFHLHIRYFGDWNELYFRDYLVAHSDVAEAYGNLKVSLMQTYQFDRDAYNQGKTAFIRPVPEQARQEMGGRYRIFK